MEMFMKITGTIEFPDPKSRKSAAKILQALSPDNLRSMESEIRDDKVAVRFHSEKIGSLLATVDDFLMNVKIGEGIEEAMEKEDKTREN
ncbi:KEOPS complex subunit Pcc1 [Methanosarcina sp.]|uniref:KEOPS complex subunit Pcc1 n=3 Tax=Methanosarcina sp. TaxID=2213 RepID=UPI002988B383|nr:KEOPS complex subunit Pcc1 [Methanosarcina sp.]MDW5551659.1 KEOPS complex subunit Pcc1 [Methanosarcina sp.]MDW5555532.1 KEOPS complex subunit Pcc1 [Methanosarcina sp.]MDW5561118.1 KEOPS complex subunit Pcc1 [Methanosarcina sp.]